MAQEKFLTIRGVAEELGISEQEVIDLTEQGKIPAYKIGGVYLRFKREHVKEAKQMVSRTLKKGVKAGLVERVADFFYFNDFYILALLIIMLMLLIIFRT